MANRTDKLNRSLDGDEAQIIRDQIEETRTHMGQTIEQIQERLSPERIKQETQKAIRDATVGKGQQTTNQAEDQMKGWPARVTPTIFRARTYMAISLAVLSRIKGYFHKQLRKFWEIQPRFVTVTN